MLTGTIRKVEYRTVDADAKTLDELVALIEAQTPPGWELDSLPERRIVRRDLLDTIEAEDTAAIRGKVPDGWQLLYVMAG